MEASASTRTPSDPRRELQFYRDMLLIRRFEEKAGQLYGMGVIGGFCHLSIGLEAVIVGVHKSLGAPDSTIAGHRNHGHMLICGIDPNKVMAELVGRKDGGAKGKGGSMHLFAPEQRFFGGHGIGGAHVPLATGIALKHKYRGDRGICVAFIGIDAVHQGQIYESLHIASLWQLPILFVIENNRKEVSLSPPESVIIKGDDGHKRAHLFDIDGDQVDGMDVEAVFKSARDAVNRVRESGPFVLEAMTYRYRGHAMSDPDRNKTMQEIQQTREQTDPIEKIRAHIRRHELISEIDLKLIDKEVRDLINGAARFARNSPEPNAAELMSDILDEAAQQ